MALGVLFAPPYFTAENAAGVPYDGAQLYFYLSGTLTPADVYHDADLATPWTFPAVTDSAGRIVVYMDPSLGNLKLVLTDADDVPFGPTVDPITVGSSSLGEVFVFCSNSAALITNTTYDSGATFDKTQPGSSVWSEIPSRLSGTHVLEIDGVMNAAGTLTVALVNLTDGAPDTPIAEATLTSLTGALGQSAAITFPVSSSFKSFGIKSKVSANSGFVIGARIRRTV